MRPVRAVLRGLLVAAGTLAGTVSAASAQSGTDRALFDSLLTAFTGATSPAQVPANTRCATLTSSASRLCEGMLIIRKAEFTMDAVELNRARDLLERTVDEQPKWPMAWYALAMERFEMARAKGLSRQGPLQPLGSSSEYGGGLALIRATELDSTFTPAIEALAMAALPREGAAKLSERLDALRRFRSSLSPMGKYGAGLIEFEAGNSEEALSWFKEALKDSKIDRGMVRLAMARTMYKLGNSTDGRVVLIAGANDTSAASRLAYRKMLAFVASPEELVAWDSLKSGEHGAWFAHFWSLRDVNEGLRDGARLTEHFRRFEFAMKSYPLKEVQMGQQSTSTSARNVDISMDEISVRYFSDLRIRILAAAADTVEPTGMMVASAIARGAYQAPFRAVRALRDKLDDRGIVYVRYGAPDAHEETGEAGGAALWVYHLPDGPMAVAFKSEEFTGNAGPTRMVPHLADLPPGVRNKFCGIWPTLCATESQADMTAASTAQTTFITQRPGTGTAAIADMSMDKALLRTEAELGIKNIARATTKDAFVRTFPKTMKPSVQVAALDQLSGGTPRLVVAFAIPGNQLAYSTPPEAQGKAVYPVRVQVMLSRESDAKRVEVDTLRNFAAAKPLAGTDFLSELAEFPLPPGVYAGSVTLSQDGGAGAIAHLERFVVLEEGPALAVSDMVLGRAGGVNWNSGTMNVPFNPLNSFPKGSTASVYFQLRGLVKGENYDLVFEFFKGAEATKPEVTLSFKQVASAERMELTQALSFPTLEPGPYRVRLTVKGTTKQVSTTAALTVVKP